MAQSEHPGPAGVPSAPTGGGQAKGTGYGAGGLGSGGDRARPAQPDAARDTWDAPGVRPDGEHDRDGAPGPERHASSGESAPNPESD